jgi:hypothetical protein
MALETILAAMLIVALIALMGYAFSGGDDKKEEPCLLSVRLVEGAEGTYAVVDGSGFGDTRGDGNVYIGGEYTRIETWNDSSIICIVPPDLGMGEHEVMVRTENGFSNRLPLTAGEELQVEVSRVPAVNS